MNRIFLLILVSIFTVSTASAQTSFLKKLKKGEKQTVVFYGASAAINTSNRVWVDQLRTRLERRFPEKITFYNSRSRESALSGQRKTSRTPY